MKIKNSKLQHLYSALQKLEPEGKPPFTFPGKVRYNFARNLKCLSEALSVLESMRVKLIRERLAAGEVELAQETRIDFLKVYEEILNAETDLNLYPVTISELNLDKNQISVILLAELMGAVIVE